MIDLVVRSCLAALSLLWSAALSLGDEPAGPLRAWLPLPASTSLPGVVPSIDHASWLAFEDGPHSGLPVPRAVAAEAVAADMPPPHMIGLEVPAERSWLRDCKDEFVLDLQKVCYDFKNNYTGRSLRLLALSLAIAAPLANTEADSNFRDWYQRHVRSSGTDDWCDVGNRLGQHWLTVPVFVGAAGIGKLLEDYPAGEWVGDWGKRSIRALMVGSPSVAVLQVGLGAGRPGEYEDSSRWRPFNDKNAVAGHGFVGAVPFLTAASMTESRPLKALFFVGSFWTCWARINTDSHYLSQSILGWSIAYLAVQSVNQTEAEFRRWEIVPLDMPEGAGGGIGILFRY